MEHLKHEDGGELRKMKGDLDEGCIRALALAVSGEKEIKAYIGVVRS